VEKERSISDMSLPSSSAAPQLFKLVFGLTTFRCKPYFPVPVYGVDRLKLDSLHLSTNY
jgi:hypothetical protein